MDGRRFLSTFVLTVAALLLAVCAVLVVVDPYDRGHGWPSRAGASETAPRTAHVSRARDPQFNAALIGNSNAQLLRPDRLDALTGLRFVQLTVPGSRSPEQLAMLGWFVSHRPATLAALVFGIDQSWCTADAAPPLNHPFPFWLYATEARGYYPSLFRMQAMEAVPRRLALLMTGRGRAVADGFWDYDAGRQRNAAFFAGSVAEMRASTWWSRDARFPQIERLGTVLAGLPPAARVALVAPPVFAGALPDPEGWQARADLACIAALERIAAARPLTVVVDGRRAAGLTGDPLNFWDATHYNGRVAEALERMIAARMAEAGR